MEFSSKLFAILVIIATANAASITKTDPTSNNRGIVTNITRCGGQGTPLQLRISDCEGKCILIPGQMYDAEYDIIPNLPAPSLSIAVYLVLNPTNVLLFEIEIPNSAIAPGFTYSVKFSFVPNDILAGRTVNLRAIMFHTDSRYMEICTENEVDILESSSI